MKKIHYSLLAAGILLASGMMTACGGDDDGTDTTVNTTGGGSSVSDNNGVTSADSTSNNGNTEATPTLTKCSRPNWTPVDGLSFQSMSIVINQIDLPTKNCDASQDLIAAFIGGECHGVDTPFLDDTGKVTCNLSVYGSDGNLPDDKVVLRYYCAKDGGYYTSSCSIQYVDGKILMNDNENYFSFTWEKSY